MLRDGEMKSTVMGQLVGMPRGTKRRSGFETPCVSVNKPLGGIKSRVLPLIDNGFYLQILTSKGMRCPIRPLRTRRQSHQVAIYANEHGKVRVGLGVSPESQFLEGNSSLNQVDFPIDKLQRPGANLGAILDPFRLVF